ncbi:unnamed protein product [Rotaria sp. Silwood1]|nr:unnamed protein product [Rotaria sp. Silwood1]
MASSLNKQHPWFEICHPRPTAKYQVFIFPAAGPTGSNKYYIDMTDAEIIEEFKTMADPITRYIYDEPSYMKMLLPMLRADSQVGKEVLPETPLMISIIVYVGEKEVSANEDYLSKWKELTTLKSLLRVRMFSGHHNFQAECGPQILSCLKQDFNNIISILRMY